ncbi:MAG: hypothetical protein JOZ87_39715 [Chloroflexi bacterium]|nr:hypothetical protein [Chloroflexota bacterium]
MPRNLVGDASYASAVQSRVNAQANYWVRHASPPAYDSYVISQGGGDKYHDDNVWVALALIEQYRMGLTTSLDQAKQLFTFAQAEYSGSSKAPDLA